MSKMKFCTKCGNKLLPNAKFCYKCGAAIKPTARSTKTEAPVCPGCGSELLPNAKFCHKCGTIVKLPAEPTAPAKPKPAAPTIAPAPYKSPIAETYYEMVLRPAAEEKLAKGPGVKRRETPLKPFERR
jgi:predicted amidophosphoribosyltransferase